jgi:nitroimidazol reductase NimA-like FMN-containing flavoprotein (pyridoxamine 5'-phosphate oxidase superfamily)
MFDLHEMSPGECVALLERSRFGRLGCCKDAYPYVVPIYFAYEANTIYSFSLPGQKIEWMRENPNVCLESDERGPDSSWSCVIVTGKFYELPDTDLWRAERLRAWSLLQKYNDWWEIGALKPELPQQQEFDPIYYSIRIRSLTGRSARPVE